MSKFNPQFGRRLGSDIDDLAYGPDGGRGKQWLLGVGIALAFAAIAIEGWTTGSTTLVGRDGSVVLRGPACVAMSSTYFGVGWFLHFHYFWGLSARLCRWSILGKILAMALIVVGIAATIGFFFNWL